MFVFALSHFYFLRMTVKGIQFRVSLLFILDNNGVRAPMAFLFSLVIYWAFIVLIFRFKTLCGVVQRASMALTITFELILFTEVFNFINKTCLAYLFYQPLPRGYSGLVWHYAKPTWLGGGIHRTVWVFLGVCSITQFDLFVWLGCFLSPRLAWSTHPPWGICITGGIGDLLQSDPPPLELLICSSWLIPAPRGGALHR